MKSEILRNVFLKEISIIIFIVDVIFIIRDLKQNYLHIIFLGDLMNLILLD